ncbi:MAG: AraC family transcriptional regulator [Pseudomonadota bacterium]
MINDQLIKPPDDASRLAEFEKGHHLYGIGSNIAQTEPRAVFQMDRRYAKIQSMTERWASLWASNHLDIATSAFVFSILSYVVSTAWDFGALDAFMGLAGTASCGFSWLLARALFRSDAYREMWPLLIVAGLIGSGGLLTIFVELEATSDSFGYFLGFASSLHSLLSSSVLLLTLVEIGLDYRSDLPKREKQFRLSCAVGYATLLTVSVLWLNGAPEGSWATQSSDQIKIICAMTAIVLSLSAWRFRKKNALPRSKRRRRHLSQITLEEKHLAERIVRRLEDDKLYLEADLKLPGFAKRLGEATHRVSVCITGVLGFRNFNALVNKYRIEAAKEALMSPDAHQTSILNIALDSGFSSIGPFNRAFKSQTGTTPTTFRNRASASNQAFDLVGK